MFAVFRLLDSYRGQRAWCCVLQQIRTTLWSFIELSLFAHRPPPPGPSPVCRYHKAKFFDRRKALRRLAQIHRKLKGVSPCRGLELWLHLYASLAVRGVGSSLARGKGKLVTHLLLNGQLLPVSETIQGFPNRESGQFKFEAQVPTTR